MKEDYNLFWHFCAYVKRMLPNDFGSIHKKWIGDGNAVFGRHMSRITHLLSASQPGTGQEQEQGLVVAPSELLKP